MIVFYTWYIKNLDLALNVSIRFTILLPHCIYVFEKLNPFNGGKCPKFSANLLFENTGKIPFHQNVMLSYSKTVKTKIDLSFLARCASRTSSDTADWV